MTTTTRGPLAVASERFVQAADRLVTLYSLADEWNTLVALLEKPEVDHAAVDLELERVARDIRAKAFGLAVIIQSMDHKAGRLKEEEQRLYAKRKAAENTAERLRAYALAQLQAMSLERLDYGTHTLSRVLNPPSVNVLDAAAVPHEFERTKITVETDKRAILEHFKTTGEIVAGVEIVRTERLSIA